MIEGRFRPCAYGGKRTPARRADRAARGELREVEGLEVGAVEVGGAASPELKGLLCLSLALQVRRGGGGRLAEAPVVVDLAEAAAIGGVGELEEEQGGDDLPIPGGGRRQDDPVAIADGEAALPDQFGEADVVFLKVGEEGFIDGEQAAAEVEAAVEAAAGKGGNPTPTLPKYSSPAGTRRAVGFREGDSSPTPTRLIFTGRE